MDNFLYIILTIIAISIFWICIANATINDIVNYNVWEVHTNMPEHYNYCPYCGEELIDMLEAKEI